MLRWRILVSAVLIPAVIGLFILDARLGPAAPVLFVICVLAGLRCAWELLALLRQDTEEARFLPVAACIALLLLATWSPHLPAVGDETASGRVPSLAQAFSVCVLALLVVRAWTFRAPGGHAKTLGVELLAVGYAGVLLSVTAQLRWLGPGSTGYWALGSLIAATKLGDVGAYSVGRLLGRRKMAPHLSPGKTWAGAVGAILGAMLGATVWLRMSASLFDVTWDSRWWAPAALYGAIVGLAGLLGDLCESLIKRDMGAKDSAALLPGFGGLLDLLDSILFAGPVAVICWQLYFGGGVP